MLREDVIENAAGDRRITERDYASLAAGACRLDRLAWPRAVDLASKGDF
jgi:hypothetical protein